MFHIIFSSNTRNRIDFKLTTLTNFSLVNDQIKSKKNRMNCLEKNDNQKAFLNYLLKHMASLNWPHTILTTLQYIYYLIGFTFRLYFYFPFFPSHTNMATTNLIKLLDRYK